MNKQQTNSEYKIQSELNNLNLRLLGINFKLGLRVKKKSSHWYEYTIYCIQNSPTEGMIEKDLFSGKPEAVLGYIQGFTDSLCIFYN